MVQEEAEIVEEKVEIVQGEEPQSPGQQQQLNVSLFLSSLKNNLNLQND
jgi:hypothetical protein